jgi:alpha-1,6-mannosyltransferase
MNPTSRATATAATASPPARPRSTAAAAATTALALCCALLALPGPGLVPAATADTPRWILGLFGDGLGISAGSYLALLYVAIAAWAALYLLEELGRGLSPRALWILIGTLLALFTLAPPLLSLDLFSYLSYARLGAAEGLNPYEYAPAALPGDPAAERVQDFSDAVSVYGPLWTWLSYPFGLLGAGAGLWGLKVVAGLSVAAVAVLTARLAQVRGLAPAPAAAFIALNPLVLVHVVGGGHNDGLMVALALTGALLLAGSRPVGAGVAFVASAGLKAAGALYAPFALAGARGGRGRLLAGLVAGAVLLAALALASFGGEVVTALGVAGENQGTVSRWSGPATLSRITGSDVDPIRYAAAGLYAVAVAALLLWVGRGADWVRAAGWAGFGLLVATAWMVPWYLIWLLPLAAVSRDRALQVAAVLLTVFQAINAVPV